MKVRDLLAQCGATVGALFIVTPVEGGGVAADWVQVNITHAGMLAIVKEMMETPPTISESLGETAKRNVN